MEATKRLLAIEEIRCLKARYFRCVDTRDWAGLGAVFAPDAVFDRGYGHAVHDPWTGEWTPPPAPGPQLVHGRDAILAMIRRAVEPVATVHHGHTAEIVVIAPDRAEAIWAMSDELRDRRGRLILAGRGHYEDRYRLTDDGWRIAFSRLTRLAIVRGDGQRP